MKAVQVLTLERDDDPSGISGTSVVAEACVFSDGTTVLRWRTAGGSTGVYASLDDCVHIHGHGGVTRFVQHAAVDLDYEDVPDGG